MNEKAKAAVMDMLLASHGVVALTLYQYLLDAEKARIRQGASFDATVALDKLIKGATWWRNEISQEAGP